MVVDFAGGAEVALDVAGGGSSRFCKVGAVGEEAVGKRGVALFVADAECSALCYQVSRLFEFAIVGSENHRNAIYGSLVDVVDAHSEASAYVGCVGIAIARRQDAEAVDYENIAVDFLARFKCRIAHRFALRV